MGIGYRTGATAINPGSGTTSRACNKPTGVASGDVLVAHVTNFSAGAGFASTGPAGWTKQIGLVYDGNFDITEIWTLVAGASEPASYTWTGWGPTDYADLSIDAYTGADNTTPVDVAAAGQTNATSTSPTSPSVTTVTDGAWVISGVFVGATSSITKPAALTQRENYDSGNGVADILQATHGASGTQAWTLGSTAISASTTIALRPAGGGPVALTGAAVAQAQATGSPTVFLQGASVAQASATATLAGTVQLIGAAVAQALAAASPTVLFTGAANGLASVTGTIVSLLPTGSVTAQAVVAGALVVGLTAAAVAQAQAIATLTGGLASAFESFLMMLGIG